MKIRGYRIEVGEIEAVMEQVDGVDQAVVLVVEEADGEKALSAYYQARHEVCQLTCRKPLSNISYQLT
ncbi:hypothetical protein ACEQPO_02155 [Bacillus sp. SL00103]